MTICPDLWPSILEYIPRSDLQDFSQASPIFQQLIYEANIRMFYNDSSELPIDIYDDDIMIIRLASGKKYGIEKCGKYFRRLSDDILIVTDNITWSSEPRDTLTWSIDTTNDVAATFGYDFSIFINIAKNYNLTHIDNNLLFCRTISKQIDYIDIDNLYAMSYEDHNGGINDIELEKFTIIYQNCKWINDNGN